MEQVVKGYQRYPASLRSFLAVYGKLFIVGLGFEGLSSNSLMAAELLPQGIESKMSAGGGQTTVTGPSALAYNPANLALSGPVQVDFDLGFARFEYRYQHTNSDKYGAVTLADTAPPVGASVAYKPLETVTVGLSFLPTGIGTKRIIIDLPLDLGEGLYQSTDIESTSSGHKLGLGASYRISKRLIIGLSIQRLQEANSVSVFKAADVYPFLKMENHGVFYLPALGLRTDFGISQLGVGLSFRPAVVKHYKGRFLFDLIGEDQKNGIYDYRPLPQVDVAPQTFGLGAQWRGAPWGGFVDIVYETWSQGKTSYSRGLPIASKGAELKNTLHVYTGAAYHWDLGKKVMAAYGYQAANLGNGDRRKGDSVTPDPTPTEAGREGMSFGNTSGIPLNIWSLGYLSPFTKSTQWTPAYGAVTLFSLQGRRTVPPGFSQEGTYILNLTMLTMGGAWRF